MLIMRPLLGNFCPFGLYLDSLKKPVYLCVLLNWDVISKNSVFQGVLHSKGGALSWLRVCKAGLCSQHKLNCLNKQVCKEERWAQVAGTAGCENAAGMVELLLGKSCGCGGGQQQTFLSHVRSLVVGSSEEKT